MFGKNLESGSFYDELRSFEKSILFDLGHPLLNRVAECFVRAAGIGAVEALSKEAYITLLQGCNGDTKSSLRDAASLKKQQKLPGLTGETNIGKEEWEGNSTMGAMAGAITGWALALTLENTSQEQVVQCVITISTAANLLSGIFYSLSLT